MSRRTYTAAEVADAWGVSPWALYESVRRGDCPIPPIRVGRRLLWPRVAVDQLLGTDGAARGTTPEPITTIKVPTATTASQGRVDVTA